MNKFKNIIYILGLSIMIILPGCSDRDDEITSIDYDRLFSPNELTARIVNKTGIRLTWNAINNAESYNIEVFANGNLNFEGTPVLSLSGITEIPYIIEGLEGETNYSIRVQSVSTSISSSKWTSVTIKTEAEQIFKAVASDDLKATEVTLRWPAGQVATEITLTPGDIKHTITADEITAGAVTITGLTGETKYTVIMKNGSKTRGTIEFTTLIDLGGATAINEGDDLVAILDAAHDGDAFVLLKGEFDLGEYTLTKAVSLAGYKASEKPTIRGNFKPSGTVGSLDLKNLILDGAVSGVATRSQLINAEGTSTVGNVNIIACNIKNYKSGLIYNNTSGKFSNVKISDCIITNIVGDGGDGFDFRGGTLTSLIVENTTFNSGFRAFVRVQISSNIKFNNCTFYKICNFDNSNNSGFFRCGGGTLEVSKCLFVGTGVNTYGNWSKSSGNMAATTTYSKNIYYNCLNLWAGLYTNPSSCDATEKDPQFKDVANGDFTVQNIDVTAGDPRWLK